MKQATVHILITISVWLTVRTPVLANKFFNHFPDSTQTSTQSQAIAWLDSVQRTDSSRFWINVPPGIFFENLRGFAISPLKFYEGRTNNFCAYSALTFLPLKNDPLGFCQFMLKLYQQGRASYNGVNFRPGKAILLEAGLLKFKGALDLNPAAQMWFLCLADRFKGYLNFVNRNFDKGDENTLWASTNYAKFNRMLRKVCKQKVRARGADIIRPFINDMFSYIKERLQRGTVFLYLNNRFLYRKKHTFSRFSIPTHYIIVLDIQKIDATKINLVYWDYGLKSLQQISPKLLRKAIFGVTHAQNVK
ncbi:MAG: hypothetical protein LH619_10050 [Chitinophagaceae bacterium]|nr:hypothetical protein [Chitinophagaceae bacterium]